MIFTDIIDSATGIKEVVTNPATTTTALPEKISLITMLMQGGVLMIPLFILFAMAVWVFFERYLTLKKALQIDERFMAAIRDYITTANIVQAKAYTKSFTNPVARVIEKGIMRIGKPIDIIESSMENTGKVEMYKVQKNLSVLSSIAGIAPMFGFLGTIIGMIKLFYGISSTGEYTLNTIAGGIYTKMMTSASGLIIGLLAYMAHNYLNAQIDKIEHKIQEASTEFMDILQEPVAK